VKKSTRRALGAASFLFLAATFLVSPAFAAEVPTNVTYFFRSLSKPAHVIR